MLSSRKPKGPPGIDHLLKEWLEEKYPSLFVEHRADGSASQVRLALDPHDRDPIISVMSYSPKPPGTIYYRADNPSVYWEEAPSLPPHNIKYFDHIAAFINRGLENIKNPLSEEGKRFRRALLMQIRGYY